MLDPLDRHRRDSTLPSVAHPEDYETARPSRLLRSSIPLPEHSGLPTRHHKPILALTVKANLALRSSRR